MKLCWETQSFRKGSLHGLKSVGKGGRESAFYYALADEANKTSQQEPCYVKQLFKEAHQVQSHPNGSCVPHLRSLDTYTSTLVKFALACCAFPETLPAAWEKIDRMVGSHRSPSWEDETHLPYVKAFVKEVFRWRSVAMIGGQPHSPIEGDYCNGHLDPENSWVQGNTIRTDTYLTFRRFIKLNESFQIQPQSLKATARFRDLFSMTKNTWLSVGVEKYVVDSASPNREHSSILLDSSERSALKGQKRGRTRDSYSTGNCSRTDVRCNGPNMRPEPFSCSIIPRSEAIRETAVAEGKEALLELSVYDGETKYALSQFYEKSHVSFREEAVVGRRVE
ncbi:hypothetical protein E4T39_02405 [Aureobasidium subglaciale]|nr:hypothetical protein E4T39_02405 [Aureobasidium subglaciale]